MWRDSFEQVLVMMQECRQGGNSTDRRGTLGSGGGSVHKPALGFGKGDTPPHIEPGAAFRADEDHPVHLAGGLDRGILVRVCTEKRVLLKI
ncbi:MAG: hypothetical protein PHT99_04210 [Methanoregula sp.]|nr:hypothetical protein [Methanoregula sp.]